MSAEARIWRYEVTEVWGEPRVEVGAVLLDRWKATREWNILNFKTGEMVGGWHAKLLGEVTEPEILAQVRKPKRAGEIT